MLPLKEQAKHNKAYVYRWGCPTGRKGERLVQNLLETIVSAITLANFFDIVPQTGSPAAFLALFPCRVLELPVESNPVCRETCGLIGCSELALSHSSSAGRAIDP